MTDRINQVDAKTVAWILLAIDFTDLEAVELADIVHAADAIHHAVPLEHELGSSIRFLMGHGLITRRGKAFHIADLGRSILQAAHEGSGNIFDVLHALDVRLGSVGAKGDA